MSRFQSGRLLMCVGLCAGITWSFSANLAWAQYGGTPSVSSMRGYNSTSSYFRPTVSPYLQLANQSYDVNGNRVLGPTYQTLVRPEIEQRRVAMDQELTLERMQMRMNELQSRLPARPSGQPAKTGYGARFMSFSRYYPSPETHP